MSSVLRQSFKNPDSRRLIIKGFFILILFAVTFYGAFGMAKSYIVVRAQKISKEKEIKEIDKRIETIKIESTGEGPNSFKREKIIREKLHMSKPGEDLIIIIPPDLN